MHQCERGTFATKYVDIDLFQSLLGPRINTFVARQSEFANAYARRKGEVSAKDRKKSQEIIRHGVPCHHKREVIMKLFDFNAEKANADYEVAKKLAGEEMIKMTSESRLAQRSVNYMFLNAEGKSELEFILMYLHKK